MIRNANRNISVSRGHGYTVEKVKYAVDFINKAGRNTTIDDWVAAYNYIKGTNETATGCHKCAAAKYSASVRNYAQYGYLTLINEGHKPEEFKDEPEVEEPCTVFTENENSTELNETSAEACNEEQQVPELAEATEKQSETVAEDNAEGQQQWEKLDETVIEQGVDAVIEKMSETHIKKRTKKAKK